MDIHLKINEYAKKIENDLQVYISNLKGVDSVLLDSMAYSLLGDGKRIRPAIMLAFYELCGGISNEAYKFACALEMIHTYSLIHDDLPCMDDDEERRGKPCNHIKFGESIALLAGDALLTQAFEIVSDVRDISPNNALCAIYVLAKAAGSAGMVSGQILDLKLMENCEKNRDEIWKVYKLKTSALFSAAAQMGAVLASASEEKIEAAKNYGEYLGICFQVVDDVLDKDAENLKMFQNGGIDEIIDNLVKSANEHLDKFDGNTDFLRELTEFLKSRVN